MDSKTDLQRRAAGILMPISSLPSPHGIGSLGAPAREFVDFLLAAGQTYWQVLPLNPTGYADSPYQSFSAFAGNPYFIDLDTLCEQGLLKPDEYAALPWGDDAALVDYGALYRHREGVLRLAHARFAGAGALNAFRKNHAAWVEDYALYMAVKAHMGLRSWETWDEDIRLRTPDALARHREALGGDIDYHIFVQYLFYTQWHALKAYANARGVSIIGDIPIYVAMDSADVWAQSRLFQLDEDRLPTEVAGVPPDAFSADGQLWGNPLYRWDVMAADGYAWWMERLAACFALYDVVRIDHFRGFESYYAVPFGDTTARRGRWRRGPGQKFIRQVRAAFGSQRIIAEDLGFLTDKVRRLLKASGSPGMKVLQFAFDIREENDYLPHNYIHNSVVYTGTHDNDTVAGWFLSAAPADIAHAMAYLNISGQAEGGRAFIRAALQSVANTAVIPMADYLGQGGEGRINTPSTIGGRNWRWRMAPGVATPALAKKIRRATALYGRLSDYCKAQAAQSAPAPLARADRVAWPGGWLVLKTLLGRGKNGLTWLAQDGQATFALKQLRAAPAGALHFEEDPLQRELAAYKKLQKTTLRVPKLMWYDEDQSLIVKEYIAGETMARRIADGQVMDGFVAKLFGLSALLRQQGLGINWAPHNFMLQNGQLYYVDYECGPYTNARSFEAWGIWLWANQKGCALYTEKGDDSLLMANGAPIKDGLEETVARWLKEYGQP